MFIFQCWIFKILCNKLFFFLRGLNLCEECFWLNVLVMLMLFFVFLHFFYVNFNFFHAIYFFWTFSLNFYFYSHPLWPLFIFSLLIVCTILSLFLFQSPFPFFINFFPFFKFLLKILFELFHVKIFFVRFSFMFSFWNISDTEEARILFKEKFPPECYIYVWIRGRGRERERGRRERNRNGERKKTVWVSK